MATFRGDRKTEKRLKEKEKHVNEIPIIGGGIDCEQCKDCRYRRNWDENYNEWIDNYQSGTCEKYYSKPSNNFFNRVECDKYEKI